MQTNDPAQPFLSLIVTGKVVKFVETRPAHVRLEGQAGAPLSIDVEILPNKDFPFTILGVQSNGNDTVRGELMEQCKSDTNRCVVRVENLKTSSGRYADSIIVLTDNTAKSSFTIPVVVILY